MNWSLIQKIWRVTQFLCLAYPFSCYKERGSSYIRPLRTRPISAMIQLKCPSSHGKSGLDGTQISLGVESSAASGEAFSSKRKQDWGSTMKRIRPLLAMALALALICLGGSFAFADDEGGNRSMRGGGGFRGRSVFHGRLGSNSWRRNA